MSESCLQHGWLHAFQKCPQCDAPTEMASLREIKQRLAAIEQGQGVICERLDALAKRVSDITPILTSLIQGNTVVAGKMGEWIEVWNKLSKSAARPKRKKAVRNVR